jgi:hypothetical protein
MLTASHLTHWYNDFMIQKLLSPAMALHSPPLLTVSLSLLANVLTLGTIRDRSYDVHRDMLHCVLLFGVPAASVLACALREQHATKEAFPPDVSRSEIVRMLSVLISHLDAAAHLENSGARHGEANYNLCRKASRIFTRVIDAVLDGVGVSDVTPSSGGEAVVLDFDFDVFSGPGLEGFEGMEFSGLGPLGLGGGAGMDALGGAVDWGTVGEWNL